MRGILSICKKKSCYMESYTGLLQSGMLVKSVWYGIGTSMSCLVSQWRQGLNRAVKRARSTGTTPYSRLFQTDPCVLGLFPLLYLTKIISKLVGLNCADASSVLLFIPSELQNHADRVDVAKDLLVAFVFLLLDCLTLFICFTTCTLVCMLYCDFFSIYFISGFFFSNFLLIWDFSVCSRKDKTIMQ